MIRNIVTIGNSLGITLPKEVVKKHNLKKGGQINFIISTTQPTEYSAIPDSELAQLIEDVESRYGSALDELAKLQ